MIANAASRGVCSYADTIGRFSLELPIPGRILVHLVDEEDIPGTGPLARPRAYSLYDEMLSRAEAASWAP